MEQMETLVQEDSGVALDVLSMMTERLLPLSQQLEYSFVTEDAIYEETLWP
jgi:hypothetical protein